MRLLATLFILCTASAVSQGLPADFADAAGIACQAGPRCAALEENDGYILSLEGDHWNPGPKINVADGWLNFDLDQKNNVYLADEGLTVVHQDGRTEKLLEGRVLYVRVTGDDRISVITSARILEMTPTGRITRSSKLALKIAGGSFSSDGKLAATMDSNGRIAFWKASGGQFTEHCQIKGRPASNLYMSSKWLAYRVNSTTLQVVDIGECSSNDINIERDDLETVAVNDDFVVVGTKSGDILLIDPARLSGRLLTNLKGFPYLSFIPNSNDLVALTNDSLQILKISQPKEEIPKASGRR